MKVLLFFITMELLYTIFLLGDIRKNVEELNWMLYSEENTQIKI